MFKTGSITQSINRLMATAQNGLEVLRLGGLDAAAEDTPFDVVEKRPMYRLRRYFPDSAKMVDGVSDRPPVLLIPPMMMAGSTTSEKIASVA